MRQGWGEPGAGTTYMRSKRKRMPAAARHCPGHQHPPAPLLMPRWQAIEAARTLVSELDLEGKITPEQVLIEREEVL